MPFLIVSTSAEDEATIDIHMIKQDTRTRLNNPVIVSGIWHYVNVTPTSNDFEELTLKLFKGTSAPDSKDRDETNYYEWKYDVNTQQWTDVEEHSGYTYINPDLSQKNDNTYSFCVGVSQNVIAGDYYYLKNKNPIFYENLTLEIFKDGSKIYTGSVVVELNILGCAKTHGDKIIFNVDPFTEMIANGDDYIKIANTGNTPIKIEMNLGKHEDLIDIPNLGITIPPFDTLSLDGITLDSGSWKPGTKTIKDKKIEASIPSIYKITTAPLTFDPIPLLNAPDFEIRVGRDFYELEENIFDNTDITFQYPKTLSMYEGEEKDITLYVSGDGLVTLNFLTENIKIVKIVYENTQTSPPITINSKNTSEYPIKIKIQALRQDLDARLTYSLTYAGNTREFYTEITIGPPETTQTSETDFNTIQIIAIVGIFALVIIYMWNTRRRHRRY
jgi:hypothetical protein